VGATTKDRKYPVDQTTGYAQNLVVISERSPDFIAIAGDLVQSGGEQRDWEEFWSHNAAVASSVPIIPALGNHEYFGGPGKLGRYATVDSERAVAKFKTYFDVPGNNAGENEHAERYYALKYGPVTLIVLDGTDGLPHQSDRDANWRLVGEGEGGVAPDWHEESEQYHWLANELAIAQADGQLVFVMFHGSPYTSGVHGQPPGAGRGEDILSTRPLQALTPLLMRNGVAAVFGGHDEMYEHSVVVGERIRADGTLVKHELHFYDIGIGGDGLRGPRDGVSNPNQVFLAHTDAPETYSAAGILESGGKHYGHLEINVVKNAHGAWQALLDAVYIFPVMSDSGQITRFERRIYDDSVTFNTSEPRPGH
jgi:3',5'-cyclic AMP phosphodiesterase CpdA